MALRYGIRLRVPNIPLLHPVQAEALLRQEVGRAIQGVVEDIATQAKQRTPVRTGLLRASIGTRVTIGRDASHLAHGEIFTGKQAPYAEYVEHGTRPHVIVPRTKLALWWPGARHPVRRVNHPGMRGRHMFRDAMAAVKPTILPRLQAALDRAARLLVGGR